MYNTGSFTLETRNTLLNCMNQERKNLNLWFECSIFKLKKNGTPIETIYCSAVCLSRSLKNVNSELFLVICFFFKVDHPRP